MIYTYEIIGVNRHRFIPRRRRPLLLLSFLSIRARFQIDTNVDETNRTCLRRIEPAFLE